VPQSPARNGAPAPAVLAGPEEELSVLLNGLRVVRRQGQRAMVRPLGVGPLQPVPVDVREHGVGRTERAVERQRPPRGALRLRQCLGVGAEIEGREQLIGGREPSPRWREGGVLRQGALEVRNALWK